MNLLLFLRQVMLPLGAINDAVPKSGLIYEIGCGWGAISTYLGNHQSSRRLIGIDFDADKVKTAASNCLPNVLIKRGDAFTYHYNKCVGVIMSDFLHHVPYYRQTEILKIITEKLTRRGVLVIKEIDKDDEIRMWLSRFWDIVFYPKDKIYYRTKSEFVQLLTQLGYQVKVKREIPWFPGSTHLYVCTKIHE